jgi:hypothetical protein
MWSRPLRDILRGRLSAHTTTLCVTGAPSGGSFQGDVLALLPRLSHYELRDNPYGAAARTGHIQTFWATRQKAHSLIAAWIDGSNDRFVLIEPFARPDDESASDKSYWDEQDSLAGPLHVIVNCSAAL